MEMQMGFEKYYIKAKIKNKSLWFTIGEFLFHTLIQDAYKAGKKDKMAILYQHEKNILKDLIKYHQSRAEHFQEMAERPRRNTRIYLKRVERELEKVKVLKKSGLLIILAKKNGIQNVNNFWFPLFLKLLFYYFKISINFQPYYPLQPYFLLFTYLNLPFKNDGLNQTSL